MRCRIIDENGRLGMTNMIREAGPDQKVIKVVEIQSSLFAAIINCGKEQRENHINELLSTEDNYAL